MEFSAEVRGVEERLKLPAKSASNCENWTLLPEIRLLTTSRSCLAEVGCNNDDDNLELSGNQGLIKRIMIENFYPWIWLAYFYFTIRIRIGNSCTNCDFWRNTGDEAGARQHCTVPHACRVSSHGRRSIELCRVCAVQLCRAQNVRARLIEPAIARFRVFWLFHPFPVFSELPVIPFGCCARFGPRESRRPVPVNRARSIVPILRSPLSPTKRTLNVATVIPADHHLCDFHNLDQSN